ncbi:MAG: DUF1822 family protein [Geitlerinemataceae cyanobacterium]
MNIDRIKEMLTFRVHLSSTVHRRAKARFNEKHLTAQRAKQVYLNLLSAYAIEFYLHCMGFETDEAGTGSNDRVTREFADVADVMIKSIGRFECRPVLPGDRAVSVPLEAQCDRRGYFAVQLNAELTEAHIVGFLKKVTAEEVPLEDWQSLDSFLQYASHLESTVKLNQWLHNEFETGWETVEALLSEPKMAWRSSTSALENPRSLELGKSVERVKRLTLERSGEEIALLVRLSPRMESQMGIGVEVHPTGDRTYLPQDLKLMVLDEEGIAVMQAEARSTKNIQLKFSGEIGEGFSVKVALGGTSVTEAFTI